MSNEIFHILQVFTEITKNVLTKRKEQTRMSEESTIKVKKDKDKSKKKKSRC